jgi:23S rRNA pseudouridine955/2504/2580 synthase
MKEIIITSNESGQRFDKFLRKYLKNLPLSAIYKAIRKKDITVNGKKSSEKYMLNEGDIVNFYLEVEEVKKEKKLDFLQLEYDFEISYEDENILVAEKRANVLVHRDEGNEFTLTDAVMAYLYDKEEYRPHEERTFAPAPCNRLDRNTEGLVVFAKNFETLRAVNEMIRNGDIQKFYVTFVKGKIEDGTYKAFIVKNPNTNRVNIYKDKVFNSKEIITKITTVDSIGQFSQIEIDLITGRSHQIRAHLAWLGNPIVGDPKYGDKKSNTYFINKYGLQSQLLVAYKLVFRNCPEKLSYLEGKTITMPLPGMFKKIKNDMFKF